MPDQRPATGYTVPPMEVTDWRRKADDEKLMLFVARFPTAADLGKFLDEHDKLVEEAQRRAWLFSAIKTVALWTTAVAGALAVLKGYLNDLGAGGGKP